MRGYETAELALDQAGEGERRPVFVPRADDLDAAGKPSVTPIGTTVAGSPQVCELGPYQPIKIGEFLP